MFCVLAVLVAGGERRMHIPNVVYEVHRYPCSIVKLFMLFGNTIGPVKRRHSHTRLCVFMIVKLRVAMRKVETLKQLRTHVSRAGRPSVL